MSLNGKWVISLDEEKWETNNYGEFDTKDDALNYLRNTSTKELYEIYVDETGDEFSDGETLVFYVGQFVNHVPVIDGERVIDRLSEDAYDEVGEMPDDYLHDVPDEQVEELHTELNKVLNNWLTKYGLHPTFYLIENIDSVTKEF